MKPAIVMIDQIDPERLAPGGTDTCVHDMVKHAPEGTLGLVGITASKELILGHWTEVLLAGKPTPFLPVARFDRTRAGGLRIPESLRLAVGLIRYWRKIPKTMLHVHRAETGALVRALGSRAYVQFLHNDASGLTGRNSDSVWKYLPRTYHRLEALALRSAQAVILFSIGDSARVRALTPSVELVETWFDPEIFVPRIDDWTQGDVLNICFIGRLEGQKDPVLAARAFAHLYRVYPNSIFRIVGEGSLRLTMENELESLGVRERAHFLGALPLAEVARIMRQSDVMLMTSHYEGSPRVIAEAGASGLPLACTEESDPDHVIRTGVTGQRIGSRDPEALGKAILEAAHCDRMMCAEYVSSRSADQLIPVMLNAGQGRPN